MLASPPTDERALVLGTNLRLVVIEERPLPLNGWALALERAGFRTAPRSMTPAQVSAGQLPADADLLLLRLGPTITPEQVMTALRQQGLNTPVILLCDPSDEARACAAMQQGVADYVTSAHEGNLPDVVRRTLEHRRVLEENQLARLHSSRGPPQRGGTLADSGGTGRYVNA